MTQALNLALFANNLNTSGATSNAGLQNSAVTVTAGTGMSGGGSVALGSSVTLNNAGVTSVTAGSGISVSASTGGVTISASGGGVTSLNGQTGAITNTSLDTIGSVVFALHAINSGTGPLDVYTFNVTAANNTVAGSSLRYTWSPLDYITPGTAYSRSVGGDSQNVAYNGGGSSLSGTWRFMGYAARVYYSGGGNSSCVWLPILCVRVS
jgi:hypothetical protein